MPLPLRLLTYLVPARYFLVVVRGVFLKGVGPSVLWPEVVLMAVYAALTLALAVHSFRKELT
jgi:ABC-2 type transport system permease protein